MPSQQRVKEQSMTGTRILVAEDDSHIREGLIDTLESEGYAVTAAGDGEETLRLWRAGAFDLILLDVMMPGKSGYDVCREIRKTDSAVPIVMLTAKGEEIDKVVGLELGADDYVTKPFGVRELLARIGAVLRRSRRDSDAGDASPDVFRLGQVEISRKTFRGSRGGQSFDLTPREMEVLEYFHDRPGVVISREKLLRAVWGYEYYGTTRTVDQHIAQLRKKVEADPARPELITTVHGVGYRYEGDAE